MSVLRTVQSAGTTRILTRRDAQILRALPVLVLALAAALTWLALIVTGSRPKVTLRRPFGGGERLQDSGFQFPVEVDWGDPNWPAVGALAGGALLLLWLVVWRPLARVLRRDPRDQHLAGPRQVRAVFGRRAVRRTGAFTRPGLSRLERRRLPTAAFGVALGEATRPKAGPLWVSFDRRLRLIAAPGWGKTHRVLIPAIRSLPGAALVTSTEPDIFLSTVAARAPVGPVVVVECAPPAQRVAGRYPSLTWNPIPGCEDYEVAKRRARALVKGVVAAKGTRNETARWFEDTSAEVLAAYLHAAAFDPSVELTDVARWLDTKDIGAPVAILRQWRKPADVEQLAADLSSAITIRKHLDPSGERTTSGVERYLALAVGALVSHEGLRVTGSRAAPGFDLGRLVAEDGTLYLLADPATMGTVRPLLSLIAAELVVAAERVARSSPHRRLARPFCAVLDELRYGVRLDSLPFIANTGRKFGLTFLYACTNGGDEEALYDEQDAQILRATSVTLLGGWDERAAEEVTSRAGQGPVVAARHGEDRSDGLELRDVITAADQNELADGDMIVLAHGIRPFYGHARSTYEQRRLNRQLNRERRTVQEVHRVHEVHP